MYHTPGVNCPKHRREMSGMQYAKYRPMIARLKIELMAIVFTNISRPSIKEQNATKPTARAGVLLEDRTRSKLLPGSP